MVFSGWDFLPPLFWGWVRFPSCLLAFLAFRPGWGWGVLPSAWLSGCSQVTSKCTPVPGLPALLRHRGNCPGWGACLGSSVESSPQLLWSETLPFLLFSHRPHRHRISKEQAHSDAEPEGRPASTLPSDPLPWASDQRTTGPRAWH